MESEPRPWIRMPTAMAVAVLCLAVSHAAEQATPQVIAFTAHDPDAFTQGLLLYQGSFYESTGLYGESSLREVDPATGNVLMQINLPANEFGEGLARVGQQLIQLTFQENVAHKYDIADFSGQGDFPYNGQGWGLCYDGQRLVMSNGSSSLFFRDPVTFQFQGQVPVTLDGNPVANLNELECVDGSVYANIWFTDTIVEIDPDTGEVLTEIDASGLLTPQEQIQANVLNGIAYDPVSGHFFITGKLWPKVFEVVFVEGGCTPNGMSPVTGVSARKDGLGGVIFEWDADPNPETLEYHVNSVTSTDELRPPGAHRMDIPDANGVAQCDALLGATSCTDADAMFDPAPFLLYQVFSACGPLGTDEGP